MDLDYLLLAIAWLFWCFLHSVLISRVVSKRLQDLLGRFRYYYRLLYNIFACVTLLPVMIVTVLMRGNIVFAWRGGWVVIEIAMLAAAFWLFCDGARRYDMDYMLGLEQIRKRRQQRLLGDGETFSQEGSLGLIRHPWYLGSLLFIWGLPVYHQSSIIVAVILTLYLFVGARLEERKLIAEFQEKYRRYQEEVSMFIPWEWIKRKLRGKG